MTASGSRDGAAAKEPEASAPAEPSLHEKILTEFVDRLRSSDQVGDDVASALAALLRGPRIPKRDAIAETVRKALDAKDGADGSTL